MKNNASIKCLAYMLSGAYISACSLLPKGENIHVDYNDGTFLPIEHNFQASFAPALRLDLETQKNRLDILVINGAERCFPASVSLEKTRQHRIAQELIAGMYFDASNLLLVHREEIFKLENRLDAVNRTATCYPPATNDQARIEHELERIRNIEDLLNSDNQFAIDSALINPKYRLRLDKAAVLLKSIDHYTLIVSGHTDISGSAVSNVDLSKSRATAVAEFLISKGINQQHIRVDFYGEDQALFPDDDEATRLVNRRVDIRLLHTPGKQVGL